jgi:hypothetical protein
MPDNLPRCLLAAALLLTLACQPIAIWAAPRKTPVPATAPEAKAANTRFWEVLHGGRYDELPEVIEGLQRIYVEHPADPETAAHLGFAHLWRITESVRLVQPPATVTDEMILARKYLGEAVGLVPEDARFQGLYAAATMGEGAIHGDEKLLRTGYFALMDSVDAWPEFNIFVTGFVMSRLPHDDPKFADALELQWRSADLCGETSFDRVAADFSPYMSKERRDGPKRACWNSWIAPHNFEGFFLNWGDMLVKYGDVETAKKIYANARLSKTYDSWPFKDVLERRIVQAAGNVKPFREMARGEGERTMMIVSSFACVACHQKGPGD